MKIGIDHVNLIPFLRMKIQFFTKYFFYPNIAGIDSHDTFYSKHDDISLSELGTFTLYALNVMQNL